MLAHSFDRFYVVTKFILPSIWDLKLSKLDYDNTYAYLDEKNSHEAETRIYTLDHLAFCKKVEPYVIYYKNRLNHIIRQHTIFWKMKLI